MLLLVHVERNQAFLLRRAVISSDLKVGTYTVVNSLTSPERYIISSEAANCRKMVLHGLFSQPHEDTSLHTCGKFSFHTNVERAMLQSPVSLLSAGAKCCHPALYEPKVPCWMLRGKILCILIRPALFFLI